MESRLGARPVTVSVAAELLVPVDNVLIEQVLVNLLENAAKYTPPGTPIDVSAQRVDEEIVVEVADRGPGIPDDEQERISTISIGWPSSARKEAWASVSPSAGPSSSLTAAGSGSRAVPAAELRSNLPCHSGANRPLS